MEDQISTCGFPDAQVSVADLIWGRCLDEGRDNILFEYKKCYLWDMLVAARKLEDPRKALRFWGLGNCYA